MSVLDVVKLQCKVAPNRASVSGHNKIETTCVQTMKEIQISHLCAALGTANPASARKIIPIGAKSAAAFLKQNA